MAADQKQIKEVWQQLATQLDAGNISQKNEQGEDIVDIQEDWDDKTFTAVNPPPSLIIETSPLANSSETDESEDELDDLFDALEGLDISQEDLIRQAQKTQPADGLKRGFLLGKDEEKRKPPKGILKKTQDTTSMGSQTSSSEARHQNDVIKEPTNNIETRTESRQSKAFTGVVVERQDASSSVTSTKAESDTKVSRFKQRHAEYM